MARTPQIATSLILTAIFAFVAQHAPLSATQRAEGAWLLAPDAARPGDPVFASWFGHEPGFSGELRLLAADGAVKARARSFALPERPQDFAFALGLADTLAPGAYRLELLSLPDGYVLAEKAITVLPRSFRISTVRLSAAASAARDDPDPRREEQAVRYQKVLGNFDPAAVHAPELPRGPSFAWPLASIRFTAYFGDRRRYLSPAGKPAGESAHYGIDFGAPTGTPVLSPGPGKVVLAEFRVLTGNTIILEHLPGVYSIFMHMDSLAVATGDSRVRGQVLGTVGSTGFSTGPHLHWELRVNGTACDPEALVRKP
ncbi:MAG TPA: M23 family metallopeptidase [Spirochaetales bacterium]|nr:M23 family metallopeptidase [Spirochaetales bacterium]